MNLSKILRQTDEPAKQTVSASPLESRVTAVRDFKSRIDSFISRKAALEQQAAANVAALDLSEAACASFSTVNAGLALAAATDKALREAASGVFNRASADISHARDRVRQTHFDIDNTIRDLAIAALPPELAGVEVFAKETHAGGIFAQIAGSKNVSMLHIAATTWGKAEAAVRYDPSNAAISGWGSHVGIDSIAKRISDWIPSLDRLAKEEARSVAALGDLRAQLRKAA